MDGATTTLKTSQDRAGFTLIELMLAMTIAGIIAAMAMPSLTQARNAAVEASTIGTLGAIRDANTMFAQTCTGGFYAPSMTWLKGTATGKAAFIGTELQVDAITKQGYSIKFSAGAVSAKAPASCNGLAAAKAVASYFVGADPLTTAPGMGARHFGFSFDGTIYQSTARIKAYYSGVPPAPAKALR